MKLSWKIYGAIMLAGAIAFGAMRARAADDASMPNIVQAIRETDQLLSMVRGMLMMTENDIAQAKGRAGAPLKDLEEEREAHADMVEKLTKERARLQSIVDAWGEAFKANMELGQTIGELNETRNRLLTWRQKNQDGSVNRWYLANDIARMRKEVQNLEKREKELKLSALNAQKKFGDLMKKNDAREAAADQLREGTEAFKRELGRFPDPEYFVMTLSGKMIPKNERLQTRFLRQPLPHWSVSPEFNLPSDMEFPTTIPFPLSQYQKPPVTSPFQQQPGPRLRILPSIPIIK